MTAVEVSTAIDRSQNERPFGRLYESDPTFYGYTDSNWHDEFVRVHEGLPDLPLLEVAMVAGVRSVWAEDMSPSVGGGLFFASPFFGQPGASTIILDPTAPNFLEVWFHELTHAVHYGLDPKGFSKRCDRRNHHDCDFEVLARTVATDLLTQDLLPMDAGPPR